MDNDIVLLDAARRPCRGAGDESNENLAAGW
jgi:hypothetical protein